MQNLIYTSMYKTYAIYITYVEAMDCILLYAMYI